MVDSTEVDVGIAPAIKKTVGGGRDYPVLDIAWVQLAHAAVIVAEPGVRQGALRIGGVVATTSASHMIRHCETVVSQIHRLLLLF